MNIAINLFPWLQYRVALPLQPAIFFTNFTAATNTKMSNNTPANIKGNNMMTIHLIL